MHFPIRKVMDRNKFVILMLLFAGINFISVSHAVAQTPVATPNPALDGVANTAVDNLQPLGASVENFLAHLTAFPQSSLTRLVLVAVGVLLLVAGWRIYQYVILIAGAIMGATIAGSLVELNVMVVNLLVLLIGGFIGAGLSMFLYYIAVFLMGAHLGIILTNGLAMSLALTPVSSLALLAGGIIGGLILLGLSFEFLIVLSALVGGQMLSLGLGLSPMWTLLFAVIGVLVQYGLTRVYHYEFRRHWDYRTHTWVNS